MIPSRKTALKELRNSDSSRVTTSDVAAAPPTKQELRSPLAEIDSSTLQMPTPTKTKLKAFAVQNHFSEMVSHFDSQETVTMSGNIVALHELSNMNYVI